MMNCLKGLDPLRWLLSWALALALPMQGLAAQGMGLCGPIHHGPVAQLSHPAADNSHLAAQGHRLTLGAAHAAHVARADQGNLQVPLGVVPGAPAQASSAAAEGSTADVSSCSACASCCAAAALPCADAVQPALVPPAAYATLAPPHRAEIAPGSPKRPPRTALA